MHGPCLEQFEGLENNNLIPTNNYICIIIGLVSREKIKN